MRSLTEIINDPASNLVDVRTPAEVQEVSVPRAENIPMDKVIPNLDRFRKMEGDIVLFCRSGARSEQVKLYLNQNGVTNVVNGGGYADIKQSLNSTS